MVCLRKSILISFLMLVSISLGVFYLGARYGSYLERQISHTDFQPVVTVPSLATIEPDSESRLNALALKLGQLQSQLLRLNVIGRRVVEKLDIGKGEFDFSASPAMGGVDAEVDSQAQTYEEVLQQIASFSTEIEKKALQLNTLNDLLTNKELEEKTLPAGQPVRKGWLTSTYGWRTDPFSGKRSFHSGVDFAGKKGADVVAVASGLVVWAGRDGGYGNSVAIDHGDGYVTRYAHNTDLVVSAGDMVNKGDTVAHMGSTGHSTGTHVHFEVLLDNKKINPMKFIRRNQNQEIASRD